MTPLRQDVLVEFLNLGADTCDGSVRVLTLLQQDDAFNDVRIIDDLAVFTMDGAADLAEADLRAFSDSSNITNAQSSAILRLENGVFDIRNVGEETNFSDIDLLLP